MNDTTILRNLIETLKTYLEEPSRRVWIQAKDAKPGHLQPIREVVELGDEIHTEGAEEGDVVIRVGW